MSPMTTGAEASVRGAGPSSPPASNCLKPLLSQLSHDNSHRSRAPSPPSFDCNSSIDDGTANSETGEAITTSPFKLRESASFSSQSRRAAKPYANGILTANGKRFCHQFKMMS